LEETCVISSGLPPTLEWTVDERGNGALRLIDQRRLPGELAFVECRTVAAVAHAIRELAVRGAPAIGAAAAYGVAIGARDDGGLAGAEAAAAVLRATRPTAVNLAWAIDRVLDAVRSAAGGEAGDGIGEDEDGAGAGLAEVALRFAHRIAADDVAANRAMGAHGAELVPFGARILTHCNAGHLATVGYGTAVGVIRAAWEAGKAPTVWVDETRPVLQGARLTAWELQRLGIPATLVADVMAGSLMASGDVDLVIVGADRIAANGDVANKIGTYTLAVLARHHGIPFYVAAPTSTIDAATATGADIVVEERDQAEVTELAGVRIAPAGMVARNRAFDVTPAALVTAVITERGVTRPPRS
jgi:methylthioribose-1-phosphate isomerase